MLLTHPHSLASTWVLGYYIFVFYLLSSPHILLTLHLLYLLWELQNCYSSPIHISAGSKQNALQLTSMGGGRMSGRINPAIKPFLSMRTASFSMINGIGNGLNCSWCLICVCGGVFWFPVHNGGFSENSFRSHGSSTGRVSEHMFKSSSSNNMYLCS